MRRKSTYKTKIQNWRAVVPFNWRNRPGASSDWRPSRFSTAVDTGQWWYGCPEQATAFLKMYGRSMLIGVGKAVRQPRGVTYTTGSTRPHEYIESIHPFLYDLADSNHVKVFANTFRHMVAFAVGAEERKEPFFRLKLGDRKVLCSTPMTVYVTDPDTRIVTQEEGYEELVVECENANYSEPGNKVYAWDEGIREEAWREWRKKCTPVPRLVFKLYRKNIEGEYARYAKSGSVLYLPVKVIPEFAKRLDTLIREFWVYLQRYPEQTVNGTLVHPPQLDSLMGTLVYVLERSSENSLFTNPELYNEPKRYSQEYLNVLDAYDKKQFRYPPHWKIEKYEVERDLNKAKRRILLEKALRVHFLTVIATALLLLKTEKIFRLAEEKFQPKNISRLYSTSPIKVPQPTARGPP